MKKDISLITIGYAKQALISGTREQVRMSQYAEKLTVLHIIVFTKKSDGYTKPVAFGKLMVHPTHSSLRIFMLYDAFMIGRRIIKQSPGSRWIVSSQDPFETSVVGRMLARILHVAHHVQLHGDNFSNNIWRSESLSNKIRYFFGLHILKTATHIRVVSERIKRSLIECGVQETRIIVLPIRPELESFLQVPYIVRKNEPYTFLFIGRLAPEKNIVRILEAFSMCMRSNHDMPQIRLRIVGKGPEEARLRAYTQKNNIEHLVEFVPWTENVPNEMAKADVFLLASKHEAYALTLIEAMAVGLPIITTDVGCVDEVVKDGIHGIVVYEDTIEAYAVALREMIQDNDDARVRYSEQGRNTARSIAMQSVEMYTNAWIQSLQESSRRV
jgi:glycosyltransferase involved in cell wall biosynthesis